MEGNWASLIVGRKFTVFSLFFFLFEGNFQVQAPWGLYLEGRFNGGFFALRVWGAYIYLEGLIHGGAYFRNFTVFCGITWYNLFGRRFRNPMVTWRPNYALKNYPGLFLKIVGLVNRNICSKFEMWSKI